MKTIKILLLFSLSLSSEAWSLCHVNFDLENINTATCPALGGAPTATNLQIVKSFLDRIYHSRPVQSDAGHCGKYADLVKSLCQNLTPVTSFFSTASSGGRMSGMSISSFATDARVQIPPNGVTPSSGFPPFFSSTDCSQIGKEAVTLTRACTEIHRCELRTFYQYSAPGGVRFVNGVWTDMQGNPIDPTIIKKGVMASYLLSGNCSSDNFSAWSEYYDKSYVAAAPGETSPRLAKPMPFCDPSSTSCLKYNIPLLKQNSQDVLDIVSKKTRVARAQDVGFCAPTTLGMLLVGLHNQSPASFGDALDAVTVNPNTGENFFLDPLDGTTARNWSGAVFRAGQMMGTDWWIGGTESDQNGAVLKGNLGSAAGTLDDFMGPKSGYTNSNMINFFNSFGGLVQVSLGMDATATGKDGVYHSLLLAGHANNHLNIMDPWGRTYLVDMSTQTQNSVFHRMNATMLNYADTSKKVFTIQYVKNQTIYTGKWTFGTPPQVGDLFPAWWWNSVALQEVAAEFERVGAVTRVTKTGQAVPTVTHIDSIYTCNPNQQDKDFIACAPSQKALMIPGTEVAAVNPGQGAFFDGGEDQNVIDELYGIGQRARGISYANNKGLLTDASMSLAKSSVASNQGWIGAITADLINSSQSNCANPMTLVGGVCQRMCPTGMIEIAGNVGTPCKGSHTCWAKQSQGLVSGAISADVYKQKGWYVQCMAGQQFLSEGCPIGTTKIATIGIGPCGNNFVCARKNSDSLDQNLVEGKAFGYPDWDIQCEIGNSIVLKPTRKDRANSVLPILQMISDE